MRTNQIHDELVYFDKKKNAQLQVKLFICFNLIGNIYIGNTTMYNLLYRMSLYSVTKM